MLWSWLPLALLASCHGTLALRYPLFKRSSPQSFQRRVVVDMNGSFGNGSTVISNVVDTQYFIVVEANGDTFTVRLDTGSSDLVLTGNVTGSNSLGKDVQISYAAGLAQGTIATADLVLDQFTIKNQAFVNIPPNDQLGQVEGLGILGVGPSAGSVVRAVVNNSDGNSPMDRIFKENPALPNFVTVFLTRDVDDNPDPEETPVGQFSIGEVLEGWDQISSQPKLPALVDIFKIQHWQTFLDPNGATGPDGKRITTRTTVENQAGQDSAQLEVGIDSGFPTTPVPKSVADAFYGRIPGAGLLPNSTSPIYTFPCWYELNVSFWFAGVEFPIHPLDLGAVDPTDPTNQTCIALFQEIPSDLTNHTAFGAIDAIMGDSFLRNAYILLNYGNFIDGSPKDTPLPFMQFLPITDRAQAHLEFVQQRLKGKDTTGSQPPLFSTSKVKSTGDIKSSSYQKALRISVGALIGFIILGIVVMTLFIALLSFVVKRFRRRNQRQHQPYHFVGGNAQVGARYPEPLTYGAGYQEPQFRFGSA